MVQQGTSAIYKIVSSNQDGDMEDQLPTGSLLDIVTNQDGSYLTKINNVLPTHLLCVYNSGQSCIDISGNLSPIVESLILSFTKDENTGFIQL